jgi:hypothetical protein
MHGGAYIVHGGGGGGGAIRDISLPQRGLLGVHR